MYVYQVIFQHEFNNLYLLGFYKDLDDCIDSINEYLGDDYKKLEKGDLVVRPSTFDMCIDKEIYDKDESNCVYVRGFVFDNETLIKEVERFKKYGK